ncbi:MAG TPA: helix-hairpin-helix domain-containing protein [Candidatus Thermoplasmatota archaeon]|nr:helix-hairpin-helix domain-containing protein [Candidatus Thermoplasmatota archaeon]
MAARTLVPKKEAVTTQALITPAALDPEVKLADVEGIGPALSERLLKAFGSEAAFFEAARASEVDRLAAVEGISVRKAVEVVLAVQGRRPADFLRTPRAEQLYEDILERVAAFANTAYARNRVQLLVPLGDRKAMEAHVEEVLAHRKAVEALDRDAVATLLAKVAKPRQPKAKYESSTAILVDTEEDYERLVKAGVDRFCRILTPDDTSFNDGYEVVIYAYSSGLLDLTGADNVVQVPFTADAGALVPEAVVAFYRENRPLFETVRDLSPHLGRVSVAPDVLAILDRLSDREVDFDAIETAVRRAADGMNAEIRRRTESVSLTGAEVVEMMSGAVPRKVRDIQAEVFRAGREKLLAETGEDLAVFDGSYPIVVDDEALERKRLEIQSRRKRAAFREKVDAARRLSGLKPAIEREIQALLEFDYAFALGSFALAYDLARPKFGKTFRLAGAVHLNLARSGGQRIDYEVGGEDNVVLLTGANSGGKTTLLETVAQAALLAHLGLPVNAREATLDVVEALYFFTQKRSLDAGAFESFLKGFIPIVTTPSKKLVLADELEAMTELDAASRILGTFIDLLHASASYGVCVTHMADEVSKHTQVRIDGIEARGLDEDGNLVVDRTPRMGYRARSTPELILRRLAQRASGEEKRVYDLILSKFDKNASV